MAEGERQQIDEFKQHYLDRLHYTIGRRPERATPHERYLALAYVVRDRGVDRFLQTIGAIERPATRVVSYLSAEFLVGPHLELNLLNLGLTQIAKRALGELGLHLAEIVAEEEEPGLGNGGLGRLAACYLDSLASLEVPAIGYGIRYEFGIFDQEIRDGWQVEKTDKWLRRGNPWEIPRPEITYRVRLGGHEVVGVAYDTPILGYRVDTCDLLRLFKAEAVESFDFEDFNVGDYYGAVAAKVESETLSKVLYPNDEPAVGKRLRLSQQYFFVSCALQDMLRIHCGLGGRPATFHQKFAVQLNDTHPAVAVAELMRLLLDEHHFGWEQAWDVTRRAFAYTNHTLLPEALEKWPVGLFSELLPRPFEIIREINRRFLAEVRAARPGDEALAARLSIFDESGERSVRMAHLAAVGSHTINGVAELHSELLKTEVLRDMHEIAPEKFTNVTNGVSPRRFVAVANPSLATLVTRRIGDSWLRRLEDLRGLERFVDDAEFRDEWRAVKAHNKRRLARLIAERTGIDVDPASLFDIQVKRIHEYKRQHLNVLHIVTLYNRLRRNPGLDIVPRTFVFGGKAAPGYVLAKLIIKLVNAVGAVVNADPAVAGRLRVVYYPDFNVTNAQPIYPAADLSEQISTAGKEASGTGNMKFALNGAVTIGTLDGANVEIREDVGDENFFLFGLTAQEVRDTLARGYRPRRFYEADPELREALDVIGSGHFSGGDPGLFRPIVDGLLGGDPYLLLADYRSYVEAQQRVGEAYTDVALWTRMSILNAARVGNFSSDRSIRDYCERIWNIRPAAPRAPGEPG